MKARLCSFQLEEIQLIGAATYSAMFNPLIFNITCVSQSRLGVKGIDSCHVSVSY